MAALGAAMDRKEFALALMRAVLCRIKLIEAELTAVGIAAKGDLITPDQTIQEIQLIAPGCLPAAYTSMFPEQQRGAARESPTCTAPTSRI
jgi:hypothetical protein